jgi:S-(hydroxymethyl)glutathione dehydrogenase / alcohol dehydrogenase
MESLASQAILVKGDNHHEFSLDTINVAAPSFGECRVKMLYASFS